MNKVMSPSSQEDLEESRHEKHQFMEHAASVPYEKGIVPIFVSLACCAWTVTRDTKEAFADLSNLADAPDKKEILFVVTVNMDNSLRKGSFGYISRSASGEILPMSMTETFEDMFDSSLIDQFITSYTAIAVGLANPKRLDSSNSRLMDEHSKEGRAVAKHTGATPVDGRRW